MNDCWVWWHMPLIPLISDFEAILVYKVSSRIAKATEKPCLEKPHTKNKQTNKQSMHAEA
jgi:hypothetical protein